MIAVTVKVDWGQETIQKILPELKKHVEITLQEPGCDDFLFAVDVTNQCQTNSSISVALFRGRERTNATNNCVSAHELTLPNISVYWQRKSILIGQFSR